MFPYRKDGQDWIVADKVCMPAIQEDLREKLDDGMRIDGVVSGPRPLARLVCLFAGYCKL